MFSSKTALLLALASFAAGAAPSAWSQQTILAEATAPAAVQPLPDAPDPQQSQQDQPTSVHKDQQSKRILGIVPNFRSVSTTDHLPPQTVKEKFVTASQDSFDYSSFVLPAAIAGINQATNAYPEFGQGAAGYGRYYWHAFADQTVENYMVEFIVPVATRQDTRFYTLGHGGFVKRAGYALSRVVVTRSDSGNEVFNYSEVVGSGGAAGISTLYYPSRERDFGQVGKSWGLNIGVDAATFFFREFWPDINHSIFHGDKQQ